jgi:hypothetical protein
MRAMRDETQRGLEELKRRLGLVGLNIIDQQRELPREATYIVIGNPERFTEEDLPNTKEYQALTDSYARAVAGRLKFKTYQNVRENSGGAGGIRTRKLHS